jgi:type III restriction enzyme
VLFLKEKGEENWTQYQLFIEAKGVHLLKKDQWKENFLKEVENNYELPPLILAQGKRYKLIGLPFYNELNKSEFINVFNKKLSL